MAKEPHRISRRRALGWAVIFGAFAAAGTLLTKARTSGYAPRPTSSGAFLPWQYALVQAASRRIALADQAGVPTPDEVGVADFMDRYVAEMPAHLRTDLAQLFAYIEHIAPLRSGFVRRFTELGAPEQDKVLAQLESADETLLRGGFAGLKALVFMGYYRDPRTWKIMAYDGPTKNRPASGWAP